MKFIPFEVLVKRIEERNKKALNEGQYHELRRGLFPLFQFANLFKPKEKEDEITLEILYRENVEEAFQRLFTDYAGQQIEDEEERVRVKAMLLQAFGFQDESINKLEITPRYNRYDYIFNTNEAASDVFAEILNQ